MIIPLPPIDLVIRTGPDIAYYSACTMDTNLMEPGDLSGSYLVLTDCTFVDRTVTQAPSWILDLGVGWGETELNGELVGPCWLIHQELISNGEKAMTIECKTKKPTRWNK